MRNPSSAFVSQLAGILSSAPMWHQSGRAPLRRGLLPPIEPLRTPALLGWGWRRLGRRRPPTRPTCAHPPCLHRCRNQVGRGKNEAQFGKHGKPCRRDTRLAERMAASRMSGQGKQVATRRHHSHRVDRTSGSAVVTNRGWDTNAILGHVDPHSVTESACAGSHTQVFPTSLCGWYFLSSGV